MTPARRKAGLLLAVFVLLAVAWLVAPLDALARGWLVAFAVWSGLPVGSLVLLMIHRLVGGAWGNAIAPVLRPAALAVPLVVIVFIPVAAGLWHIYPWAYAPGTAPESVVTWYLNAPWFFGRAAIALLGWSALGIVFGLGGGGPLLAGLGLTFYGLTISFAAIDWYLSSDPSYVSTAFAAMIAIQQILTALAVAAVVAPPRLSGKTAGDVGGLMIATLLGIVYLGLMTYIVDWYGDLPEKAAWYVERGRLGWVLVVVAALLLALASFGLLMRQDLRRSRFGLRIAGLLALAAIAVHLVWILVPAFAAPAAVILPACLFGLGLVLATFAIGASLGLSPVGSPSHAS